MKTKTLKGWIKAIVALALLQGSIFPLHQAHAADCKKIVDECKKAVETAMQAESDGTENAVAGSGLPDQAAKLGAGKGICLAKAESAEGACAESKCSCATTAETTSCKKDLKANKEKATTKKLSCTDGEQGAQDVSAATSDQGASPSSTSSGGGLGIDPTSLLMMAGLGYLAYTMLKKDDDKNDDDSALRPDGSIVCTYKDAWTFSECDPYLTATCEANGLANLTSEGCTQFANRMCYATPPGSAPAPGTPRTPAGQQIQIPTQITQNPDGSQVMTQVGLTATKGLPGAGIGTPFCRNVLAYRFCNSNGIAIAGRQQCPSCLQLETNRLQSCQADPSSCMAQNSPTDLGNAKKVCQDSDPAFLDQKFLSADGNLNTPPGAGQVVTGQVVLPEAIETASTSSLSTASATRARLASNSRLGTASAQAQANAATLQGAAREGQMNGQSQAVTGSTGGMNVASTSGGSNARDVASAGGGRPVSDVEARYGQNLFAIGTDTIRVRCQTHRLNCHGPR